MCGRLGNRDSERRPSEGIELARNNIRNGNARATLRGLIKECGDEEKLLTVEPILRKRH